MSKLNIVLTGGGTAGHVMPHVALLNEYTKLGYNIYYIGTNGIEKSIMSSYPEVTFKTIRAGKLRRYFDFRNFLDVFNIMIGLIQSFYFLLLIRPKLVFSKGGFVSVPVSYAAKIQGITVVTHESDVTPGLANKLLKPVISKYYYAFAETSKYLPASISKRVGIPIRQELNFGDKQRGLALCDFDDRLPVIMVMGGSLGAKRINDALLRNLDQLCRKYQIIHLTGKGKSLNIDRVGYKSFEFVNKELADLFAATDLIVSRAGANSLFEFLFLKKPMLLIPLELGSRGDQVLNAKSFKNQGWADVIRETELEGESLPLAIDHTYKNKEDRILAMKRTDEYLLSPEMLVADLFS